MANVFGDLQNRFLRNIDSGKSDYASDIKDAKGNSTGKSEVSFTAQPVTHIIIDRNGLLDEKHDGDHKLSQSLTNLTLELGKNKSISFINNFLQVVEPANSRVFEEGKIPELSLQQTLTLDTLLQLVEKAGTKDLESLKVFTETLSVLFGEEKTFNVESSKSISLQILNLQELLLEAMPEKDKNLATQTLLTALVESPIILKLSKQDAIAAILGQELKQTAGTILTAEDLKRKLVPLIDQYSHFIVNEFGLKNPEQIKETNHILLQAAFEGISGDNKNELQKALLLTYAAPYLPNEQTSIDRKAVSAIAEIQAYRHVIMNDPQGWNTQNHVKKLVELIFTFPHDRGTSVLQSHVHGLVELKKFFETHGIKVPHDVQKLLHALPTDDYQFTNVSDLTTFLTHYAKSNNIKLTNESKPEVVILDIIRDKSQPNREYNLFMASLPEIASHEISNNPMVTAIFNYNANNSEQLQDTPDVLGNALSCDLARKTDTPIKDIVKMSDTEKLARLLNSQIDTQSISSASGFDQHLTGLLETANYCQSLQERYPQSFQKLKSEINTSTSNRHHEFLNTIFNLHPGFERQYRVAGADEHSKDMQKKFSSVKSTIEQADRQISAQEALIQQGKLQQNNVLYKLEGVAQIDTTRASHDLSSVVASAVDMERSSLTQQQTTIEQSIVEADQAKKLAEQNRSQASQNWWQAGRNVLEARLEKFVVNKLPSSLGLWLATFANYN